MISADWSGVMRDMTVPNYMTPASALASEPVQVTGTPELKMQDKKDNEGKTVKDKDGKPVKVRKTSDSFPGLLAYGIRVEVIRGYKVKTLVDGRSASVPVLDELSLTVWVKEAPSVTVGQYIRLSNVMVGSFVPEQERGKKNPSTMQYIYATGVQVVEEQKND